MEEITTQHDIDMISINKSRFSFVVKLNKGTFTVAVEKKTSPKNPIFWEYIISKNSKIYKKEIKETKADIKKELFKQLLKMGFKDKAIRKNIGVDKLILDSEPVEDIRTTDENFNEEDYIYEEYSFLGLKKERIDLISLSFIKGEWKNIIGRFCYLPDIDITSSIVVKNKEEKKLLRIKGIRYGSSNREKHYVKQYIVYDYQTKKKTVISQENESRKMANGFHNARIDALNKVNSRKSGNSGMVAGAVIGGVKGGASGAVQGAMIGSTIDGIGSVLKDGDAIIKNLYKSKEYKKIEKLYEKQLGVRINIIKRYLGKL